MNPDGRRTRICRPPIEHTKKYDRFGRVRVRSLRSAHGLLSTRIDLTEGPLEKGPMEKSEASVGTGDKKCIVAYVVMAFLTIETIPRRRAVRTKQTRRKHFC